MTLAEINAMDGGRFVEVLGSIFEHSPWVAERAQGSAPFASLDALHRAMVQEVQNASYDEQLALVRAHPELAGREAQAGTLTVDSSSEQARLGFTALTGEEFRRMSRINAAYRERFGFPCIVALRLHASREGVMAEMERRLSNDPATELRAALEQIGHITRARLAKLVEEA